MKRRTFIAASIGALAFPTFALSAAQSRTKVDEITRTHINTADPLFTASGLAFGTTISMTIRHNNQKMAELAIEDAFHQAKMIDALMSIHTDTSQIGQLNRQGYVSNPHPHLLTILAECERLSRLTQDAFDITVQPLWKSYTAAAAINTLPNIAELQHAKSLVNWRDVHVTKSRVSLAKKGMSITLNGIAQGFAVDLAVQKIKERGIKHALLDTGEFISTGHKAKTPWIVGVQDPRHASQISHLFKMDGRSLATSGDYETYFTPDFIHNHIFDPATGDSPKALASVTVAAPTGLLADGLSTALFVMGPKKSLQLLATLPQVDALLIDKNGKSWLSTGMQKLAQI